MNTNDIVVFNEQGRNKFAKSAERLFLYVGNVANNSQYAIVKGFRGKYIISEEMFIENKDDLRVLTDGEIREIMESK
jgi:hypothetical protein